MVSHILNMIKEKEIDALVTPWVNAWVTISWKFNGLQLQ